MSGQPAGQWVWVADPDDLTTGRWHWYVAALPQDQGFDPARLGLYVGGFFSLGALATIYFSIVRVLHGGGSHQGALTALDASLALGFAVGLFVFAVNFRSIGIDPLRNVAAFGSNLWAAGGIHAMAESLGLGGDSVLLPFVIAAVYAFTFTRVPHVLVGLSLAVYLSVAAASLPIPGDSAAVRAILIGIVLTTTAMVVEASTKTRAASFLHYGAVLSLLVAKIVIANSSVGGEDLTAAALLPFAVGELCVSFVTQRRSWSLSAWLTAAFATGGVIDLILEPMGVADGSGYLVGPAVIALAVVVHVRRAEIARTLAAALPESLRPAFFAFGPEAPPQGPPAAPMVPPPPPVTAFPAAPPPPPPPPAG